MEIENLAQELDSKLVLEDHLENSEKIEEFASNNIQQFILQFT